MLSKEMILNSKLFINLFTHSYILGLQGGYAANTLNQRLFHYHGLTELA